MKNGIFHGMLWPCNISLVEKADNIEGNAIYISHGPAAAQKGF